MIYSDQLKLPARWSYVWYFDSVFLVNKWQLTIPLRIQLSKRKSNSLYGDLKLQQFNWWSLLFVDVYLTCMLELTCLFGWKMKIFVEAWNEVEQALTQSSVIHNFNLHCCYIQYNNTWKETVLSAILFCEFC